MASAVCSRCDRQAGRWKPRTVSILALLILLSANVWLAATASSMPPFGSPPVETPADTANSRGVEQRLANQWLAAADSFVRSFRLAREAADEARGAGDTSRLNAALRDHYYGNVNALSAALAMIYPRNLVRHVLALSADANDYFEGRCDSTSYLTGPWPYGCSHPVITPIQAIVSRSYAVWAADFDLHRVTVERSWLQLLARSLWPLTTRRKPHLPINSTASLLLPSDAISFARLAGGMMETAYISGLDRYLATTMVLEAAAAEAKIEAKAAPRIEAAEGPLGLCELFQTAELPHVRSGPALMDVGSRSTLTLPQHPLRLAFLSSDLRKHSVGYALHGLMGALSSRHEHGQRQASYEVSAYATAPVDLEPEAGHRQDDANESTAVRLEWHQINSSPSLASFPPLWRAIPSTGARRVLESLELHPIGPATLMQRMPSASRSALQRELLQLPGQPDRGHALPSVLTDSARSGARRLHLHSELNGAALSGSLLIQRIGHAETALATAASKALASSGTFGSRSFLGECVWPATTGTHKGGFTQTHCLAHATAASAGSYSFFALDSAVLPSHRAKHNSSSLNGGSSGSSNHMEWISKPQDYWSTSQEEEGLLALWEGAASTQVHEPEVLFELNGRSVGSRHKLLRTYAERKHARRLKLRAHLHMLARKSTSSGANRTVLFLRGGNDAHGAPDVGMGMGAVVVSYLGSPLTSALTPPADTIDYLLADAYGLAPELLVQRRGRWARQNQLSTASISTGDAVLRSHSESILYVPAPYHPVTISLSPPPSPSPSSESTEGKQPPADKLCQDGHTRKFVYGALHVVTKIDPRTFTAWIQTVLRSPSSCSELWLLRPQGVPALPYALGEALPQSVVDRERAESGICADSEYDGRNRPCQRYLQGEDVRAALRQEAAARGLHPSRLKFVGMEGGRDNRTTMAAIYPHIDIMLDAQAWGAHSTAADMLSVGTPVLTTVTDEWPSRVAATFLKASEREDADLSPLLVTHGLAEMEEVGVQLSQRSQVLHALSRRLSSLWNQSASTTTLPKAFDYNLRATHLGRASKASYEALHLRELFAAFSQASDHDDQASLPRLPNIVVAE